MNKNTRGAGQNSSFPLASPCQTTPALDRDSLLREIHSLSFVKNELELYLDTHPTCSVALDYYAQTVDALNRYTDEYQSRFGPLTATGAKGADRWTWIDTPWPWQTSENDMPDGRMERK